MPDCFKRRMLSFSASRWVEFLGRALNKLHADRKVRSREIESLLARFGDGARCGDDIPLAVFEGGKKLCGQYTEFLRVDGQRQAEQYAAKNNTHQIVTRCVRPRIRLA